MNQAKSVPIILVDGSGYLYRAFHALPPLSTSDGRPTGAVRGVLAMLKSLIKQYPTSPMAIIFDAKGGSFRDEIYAEYKANRPAMPDVLQQQIAPLHDCIKALGLPLLCVDHVEADDVIGTLAHQATQLQRQVIISTGDKDMAQLVNAHITLVNTMKNEWLDEAGVVQKFGIRPQLMIDYLALMGDSIDNIPGIAGIGPKTALALLQAFPQGLNEIYQHLDQVANLNIRGAKTLANKLAKYRQDAFLSQQLATIKIDCHLPFGLEALQLAHPDKTQLIHLYQQLEFKGWLKELMDEQHLQQVDSASDLIAINDQVDYQIIEQPQQLTHWLKKIEQHGAFCFDLETTSLDYMQAQIVGISLAVKTHQAAYIPLAHHYLGAPAQLALNDVLTMLTPLWQDGNIIKIGQNLKYDIEVLARYQINGVTPLQDTMLASYVLNSTAQRHDMDSLALTQLGYRTQTFAEVAGSGNKQVTFDQVTVEAAKFYACEDADITLRLYDKFLPQLQQIPTLLNVYNTIEMPLVNVLARIERAGVQVDVALLKQQSIELQHHIDQLEQKAYQLAGQQFNLSSPKQMAEILFNQQKIPVIKKTPKGVPSTSESVLEELALDYPLAQVIIEHRRFIKLKSTYTDKLPQQIDPQTQRIHTSYHQAITVTGRLSSSDPNLQNIPIRTNEGRRIRQAFIARQGYRIVAADYSQIELRIMAHLSEDQTLLAAFHHNLDIHAKTAAEVFNVPLEKVSTEQRRRAKAINFGLIYGMSAWGLARQLRIDRAEAEHYISRYFERYPGVAKFMQQIRHKAAVQGFVETVFGRRLYLPEINSSNYSRRQAAERTAINAPMQGTAADIIKLAMIQVDRYLIDNQIDATMIMQVHDELVFEVAQKQVADIQAKIADLMQNAVQLKVPLIVEIHAGNNWDEAH